MFIYICHDGYNINPKKEYISPIYEEHAVIKRNKFNIQKKKCSFRNTDSALNCQRISKQKEKMCL